MIRVRHAAPSIIHDRITVIFCRDELDLREADPLLSGLSLGMGHLAATPIAELCSPDDPRGSLAAPCRGWRDTSPGSPARLTLCMSDLPCDSASVLIASAG
eukprot:754661-Hanusia_phi.AAC.1